MLKARTPSNVKNGLPTDCGMIRREFVFGRKNTLVVRKTRICTMGSQRALTFLEVIVK